MTDCDLLRLEEYGSAETEMTLPIASVISSTIEMVQRQVISAALVYTSHERWPLPPAQTLPRTPLHISVLDSSFNPPTLAHLALTNAVNPLSPAPDYDAKLLLLSVRNADKAIGEGDATLSQRVEMMSLLATRIHHSCSSPPNVAVGLVNEPTFIAKSSALRRFLNGHLMRLTSGTSHAASFQLTFLMGSSQYMHQIHLAQEIRTHLMILGFDTLERVLAPRYYPSEEEMYRLLGIFLSQEGDDARIVCARRCVNGRDNGIESLPAVTPYLESGRLAFIDIGRMQMQLSSSTLRTQCKDGIRTWPAATTVEICGYIADNKLYHSI